MRSPDTLRVLLTGFGTMSWSTVVNLTNHKWLWDNEVAWYSPSATHRICHYVLEHGRESDELHSMEHSVAIHENQS